MNLIQEVLRAEQRIRHYIKETPLEYSSALSQMTGCQVFLKLENLQHTGSFKARGAMNKLLALTPVQRDKGVVTASTGNHGAAVAFGLCTLKMKGIVFVPEAASPTKVEAIRRLGAEVRVHGKDSVQTEIFARQYAEQNAMVYVSPYNDPQVISGQGTIAVELARQLDRIDAVFVALGGGGMMAGVAGYLKSVFESAKVIACSPQNSCVMIESMKAGRILEIDSLPTLSDGTAGGVEPNAITFDPCYRLIDESVLVTEEEIRETMLMFIETQRMLIEGAAAVAVKAFLKTYEQWRGKNVVVVVCGGNVSLKTLRAILQS
ncbi:threonine/serine dehydratase [candidate division KSB1 bacterium]|nr:threonine/serine dehydratase [candidate division KSB1 bacterium]